MPNNKKKIKGKKVLKNGAVGAYVKQKDGKYKWRIIKGPQKGGVKEKQNWEKHYNEEHQTHFWHSPSRGESTWEDPYPNDWEKHYNEEHQTHFWHSPSRGESTWEDPYPNDWEKHYNEKHKTDFWHSSSRGESTWEDPYRNFNRQNTELLNHIVSTPTLKSNALKTFVERYNKIPINELRFESIIGSPSANGIAIIAIWPKYNKKYIIKITKAERQHHMEGSRFTKKYHNCDIITSRNTSQLISEYLKTKIARLILKNSNIKNVIIPRVYSIGEIEPNNENYEVISRRIIDLLIDSANERLKKVKNGEKISDPTRWTNFTLLKLMGIVHPGCYRWGTIRSLTMGSELNLHQYLGHIFNNNGNPIPLLPRLNINFLVMELAKDTIEVAEYLEIIQNRFERRLLSNVDYEKKIDNINNSKIAIIEALHNGITIRNIPLAITHGDFHNHNLLINLETEKLYVIDFGTEQTPSIIRKNCGNINENFLKTLER